MSNCRLLHDGIKSSNQNFATFAPLREVFYFSRKGAKIAKEMNSVESNCIDSIRVILFFPLGVLGALAVHSPNVLFRRRM